jgi:hypothetical protein
MMKSDFEERRERRIERYHERSGQAKVKLPSGVGSTTFDRSTGEYVVTFAESVEGVI